MPVFNYHLPFGIIDWIFKYHGGFMSKILVCDDDQSIVRAVEIYLKDEGYDVITGSNGKDAVEAVKKDSSISLAVLDVMMPQMDGMTALVEIRKFSNIPVIFLTARDQDSDMVIGLNMGADDYITKPFNPSELTARVRSQLRRFVNLGGDKSAGKNVLTVGGIVLDDTKKTVTVDGDEVSITKTEFQILKYLMINSGKVCSADEIYRNIWKDEPIDAEKVVAVHVRHIREKIEFDPSNPHFLKVVWGHGYKIED